MPNSNIVGTGTVGDMTIVEVEYLTNDTEISSIAEAIRAKGGTTALLTYPTGFVSAINAISTGGTYQSKSVSPTESQQTVSPDTGYDALSSVTVGAISSTYVGSEIDRKSSTDLTASGATVTAPAGYYSSAASKSVSSGSATGPSSISGSSASVSTGTNTLTLSKTVSVTPVVSAGYVSSGTAANSSVSLTASVTTKAAATYYPSTSDQSVAASTYLTGAQTIKAVTTSGISAANIKDGTTIKVGDASDDDRITAVTGTFTDASTVSSGQTAATAAKILSGYSAWVDGAEVKGSIASKSSSDLTASGATVTAPAGYYASSASKSVASGSATTPATTITANPTISVSSAGLITATNSKTQSVTPTVSAGYVSSGTAGTITVSGSNTSQLTVQAAQTITPTTSDQTIDSGKYLTGTQTIKGDANLVASNIKKDVSIFGVTGTYEGSGSGGYVTQDANGYIVLPSTGSGGGGGGATQHTIHLEFSDSTDTDVAVYYDNSLIGTMITAYEPSTWTYSSKTVTLAQLDNVTWYDKQSIPLNTELIDYDACLDDYAIDSSGNAIAQQWYVASDYTAIESGMTFSFKGCRWYYLAYYDSSKAAISAVYIDNISTPDQSDSNVGVGTLSTGIPSNAKYIRITGTGAMSSRLSLIRTA